MIQAFWLIYICRGFEREQSAKDIVAKVLHVFCNRTTAVITLSLSPRELPPVTILSVLRLLVRLHISPSMTTVVDQAYSALHVASSVGGAQYVVLCYYSYGF